MKILKSIIFTIWFYIVVVSLILFYGGINLIIVKIMFKKNPEKAIKRMEKVLKRFGKMVFKVAFSKVQVNGIENLPKDKPYVIVGNHQSFFDIPLIYAEIGVPSFIAKKELTKAPIVKSYLDLSKSVFIDRKDVKSGAAALRRISKLIKDKGVVCIFPEGTRTSDGNLLEFKSGTLMIPYRYNVPIVPIAIDGNYKLNRKKSCLFNSGDVKLTILPSVIPENFASEDELRNVIRKDIDKHILIRENKDEKN